QPALSSRRIQHGAAHGRDVTLGVRNKTHTLQQRSEAGRLFKPLNQSVWLGDGASQRQVSVGMERQNSPTIRNRRRIKPAGSHGLDISQSACTGALIASVQPAANQSLMHR